MIISYTGTPGSGKTYDAMKRVVEMIGNGRTIVTNIEGLTDDTCIEGLKLITGRDVSQLKEQLIVIGKDDVKRIHEIVKPGQVLVIDEVHDFFGSRDWATEKNKGFSSFCATHRHYGYDILLITQNIDKVDVQVRQMVEWTYRYRKINFFGSLLENRYLWFAYGGTDDSGECVKKGFGKYEAKYFKCYKSYAHEGIKELGLKTNTNVFKRPVFIFIAVAIIAFIYSASKSSLWGGGFLKSPTANAALVKNEIPENVKNEVKQAVALGDRKIDNEKKEDIVQKGINENSQDPGPVEINPEVEFGKNKQVVTGRDAKGQQKVENNWVAEIKRDKDGTAHMYEGGQYVGWIKTHESKKLFQ